MKTVELNDKDIDRIICGLIMYNNTIYKSKEDLEHSSRATEHICKMLRKETNDVRQLIEKINNN